VVIVGRNQAKLIAASQELQSAGNVSWLCADITRADEVASLVEQIIAQHKRVDVLVNCAGRSARGTLAATPPADFQALWEINVLAAVQMTQAALPHLTATHGHVVNIGSLASKSAPRFMGAYATTKFALAGFTQQLRLEVGPAVHVLLVCPGPIQRDDAGERYDAQAADLPAEARQPGAGVKLKALRPDYVAARIVAACHKRQPELVIPAKAKILFAISQLSAAWGDWIVRRMT
jgi:short-subunit dehydrogenase